VVVAPRHLKTRRIRIGIGLRSLTPGGVTRFILHLAQELSAAKDECAVYAFLDDLCIGEKLAHCHTVYLGRQSRLVWDYLLFPFVARRYALDYVIYPSNVIPLSHYLVLKTKRINVVHDLAYFNTALNEYKFFDSLYMRALMGISCRRADRTVADSQSTKEDLVSILRIPDAKISVAHLGISSAFRQKMDSRRVEEVLQRLGIQRPYLFYCGTLTPRKNVLRMLQAIKVLEHQIPHRLYLSSGHSWRDKEVREYWSHELPQRVVHLGYLDEEELRSVYAHADLFLYPSLYEGFGLPILEAQASGCPVLTSKLTSCPEVAGAGAHYVEAHSVQSISEGILKILQNNAYKQHLINEGYKNIERFSWKNCAMHYLALMRASELKSVV
jgi:glycosyltransferase involved in cell wall biosynthesis